MCLRNPSKLIFIRGNTNDILSFVLYGKNTGFSDAHVTEYVRPGVLWGQWPGTSKQEPWWMGLTSILSALSGENL